MIASKHILHPVDELWYKDISEGANNTRSIIMYVRRCQDTKKFYIEYTIGPLVFSSKSAVPRYKEMFDTFKDARIKALTFMYRLIAHRATVESKRL